jgi:hypothetical protein
MTGIVNSISGEMFQLVGNTCRKSNFDHVTFQVHWPQIAFNQLRYLGDDLEILIVFRIKWTGQNLAE